MMNACGLFYMSRLFTYEWKIQNLAFERRLALDMKMRRWKHSRTDIDREWRVQRSSYMILHIDCVCVVI